MSPVTRSLALLVVAALPVSAGIARILEQTTGAPTMDPTQGSMHAPILLALHIIGASAFLILGAFQFLPASRRGAWHRLAGRASVALGTLGAATGLWLTLTLPIDPTSGPLLVPMRATFAALWLFALGSGVWHIRHRRFDAHRAWMVRSYAIGAATGLQSLILIPWFLIFGIPTGLPSDLAMLAGWIAALVVGERWIAGADRPLPQPA